MDARAAFFSFPRAGNKDDPLERMVAVVQWYMSGYHTKPKGCKKPYNPILGEHFYCRWQSDDFGTTQLLSEQVSHHPPISAFHVVNRQQNFVLDGCLQPRSKFMGNSAASILEGHASLHFLNRGEEYIITFPSYVVKGILVGALKMEISGKTTIKCAQTGYTAEIEFKTKGTFFGRSDENAAKVLIKHGKDKLYSVAGRWDQVLTLKNEGTGEESEFFNAETFPRAQKLVRKEEDQSEFESRRLWSNVTAALKKNDQDTATTEKTALEDAQRATRNERKEKGEEWTPRFFKSDDGKRYTFKDANFSLYDQNEPFVPLDGRDGEYVAAE